MAFALYVIKLKLERHATRINQLKKNLKRKVRIQLMYNVRCTMSFM